MKRDKTPQKPTPTRTEGSNPSLSATTQTVEKTGQAGQSGKINEEALELASDFSIMTIARLMRLKGFQELRIWFKINDRVAFEFTKKEGA